MGTFIKDSLDQIRKEFNESKKSFVENPDAPKEKQVSTFPDPVIVRIETSSGSELPRLIMVTEVHDDYIVGHGRKKGIEAFSFNHIANWRFAPYNKKEWE